MVPYWIAQMEQVSAGYLGSKEEGGGQRLYTSRMRNEAETQENSRQEHWIYFSASNASGKDTDQQGTSHTHRNPKGARHENKKELDDLADQH